MRTIGLCFALVSLIACGTDGSGPGGGDDDGSGSGSDIDPPARGFQVKSVDIDIQPGQEITYCYYFRTPNTEPMAVHKWKSVMTPGSHHMIMFTTGDTDVQPVGTYSAQNCGIGNVSSAQNRPVWTYAAQNVEAEVELPSDDGAGKPLAQVIAPNTAGFFQMHYLNATDEVLTVNVTLNAEALEADTAYTPTAAYITYNAGLSIKPTAANGGAPSVANGGIATKTCSTPANTKFWMMSTHAHKQAVKTEVKNGMPASSAVAFMSEDWEHPGTKTWMQAPFYSFDDASGANKLTYTCTYVNDTNRTITSGDSAQTDEMCMATGYMFPATAPTFCVCAQQGCFNL